jgi:hypothetical protein
MLKSVRFIKMVKKKRKTPKQRKHRQLQTPLQSESSIILPRTKLILPMSPFDQRMATDPYARMLPSSHPQFEQISASIARLAEMDIEFQTEFKAVMRRLPVWGAARSQSGSGFLMATTLRSFFIEYFHRIMSCGPDSMPTSFNVMESFFSYNEEYLVYDLREEKEHLLLGDDYFEWYSLEAFPKEPRLVMDVMDEGVIYSYDMVGDSGGYRIKSPTSELVLAGISLIRHSNELSCLLVAGENPAYPSDREIQSVEGTFSSLPGRETLAPDPVFTTQSRYLDRYPEFARVHLLTRFDLRANTYNVRYINLDLGKGYQVLTDDESIFEFLPPDERESRLKACSAELGRYDTLYSALASLIYLPIAFVDEYKHRNEVSFKTEFYANRKKKSGRQAIQELHESVYAFERTITCLATRLRSPHTMKEIIPPSLSVERNGYWRPLPPGEVGEDKDGNKIVGRTWVSRHDSWAAHNPSSYLLTRAEIKAKGADPGIVYIVRSSSHAEDLYKVGFTRRTVEDRVSDLSNTSAPLDFGILAKWDVGNCRTIEQEVHRRLDSYRINPKREFFHCSLAMITSTIEQVIADIEPAT